MAAVSEFFFVDPVEGDGHHRVFGVHEDFWRG